MQNPLPCDGKIVRIASGDYQCAKCLAVLDSASEEHYVMYSGTDAGKVRVPPGLDNICKNTGKLSPTLRAPTQPEIPSLPKGNWELVNTLGEKLAEACFLQLEQRACCRPTPEELKLLASGEYRAEELWGGDRPTCPKCIGKEPVGTALPLGYSAMRAERAAKVDEMVSRFALFSAPDVDWRALFEQMYDAGVIVK